MNHEQTQSFLNKIFANLEEKNIDIGNWEIDHLCYRTSSLENYKKAKERFEKIGELLIEGDVNGRPIATYKLNEPVVYEKWIIDLVEVPAPKPNKETPEGLEHIEVVIDKSFEDFMKANPNVKFKTKGMAKDLNPELEVEFEDCAIKFHHKSLEHIISIEKNNRVTNFLEDSEILTKLKQYSPCISGTLPLGIETEESDLDILFFTQDLEIFSNDVKSHFAKMKNFKEIKSEFQGLESLVINFYYNDLAVELFCQNKCVFEQQANLHFLIEGRLLKILGEDFANKIATLKKHGMKTEPAFGEVLEFDDPYDKLLELNKLSDIQLYNLFKRSL